MTTETIDITPTWGEWGNIYRRMVESGATMVVQSLAADFKRAMACAAAFQAINLMLTEEQRDIATKVLLAELEKQGVV